MDKKQPPDPGNRDLDTDTTDDKITAYEEVAEFFGPEYSQPYS